MWAGRRLVIGMMAALLLVFAVPAVTGHGRAVAGEPGFWERVAAQRRDRADRLVQDAKDRLLKSNDLAGAEKALRDALAIDSGGLPGGLPRELPAGSPGGLAAPGDSDDFETMFLLAEVQAARDEPRQAIETLQRAEPLARLAGQREDCWFNLGVQRSKLGQYREALSSYERQMALGPASGTVYANAAELLMTLGRLGEAEERYRDAIRVDEQAGDRRAREHALALSYYGLGVALDRDEQPAAAREMVGRALALDPGRANLELAQRPGSDVFFIPAGDVFYYLGLAEEIGGHGGEAEGAFREFIARQPQSPWVGRARAHLQARARAQAQASPARPRWQTVAVATVSSNGPLPAPLIDAAWKQRPPPIEGCLAATAPPLGQAGVRVVLELELDARGRVARASVKLPLGLDDDAAKLCMEDAVKVGLTVTAPAHARPTSARVEVLLANGDSGRL